MQIHLKSDKKIFFASDQHFGVPDLAQSRKREERFIRWLEMIKKDAQVLFLMGDLFDFWHEWKFVVPKGYIRVLGKLAELKDAGIDIYFFVGNHDLWMKNYFEDELGIPVFFEKRFYDINGKVYFGEITFFHWSGFERFEPAEWDEKFGSWITLPTK